MEETKKYKKAITIAGSDSGGGAGIQADLKAFSANGVYGMTAITAITAQNTKGVTDIHPVPVENLEKQLRAVLDDIGTDAVKIGMLHSKKVIETVVKILKEYNLDNIVLDPVMVATSGDKLLQDEAINALVHDLMPLATIITPNLPEAEIILNRKISTLEEIKKATKDLANTKARSILLKGGHFKESKLLDIFYEPQKGNYLEIPSLKQKTNNTHGTGCTLSSAIAANLAKEKELQDAVKTGLEYIHKAIEEGAAYQTGGGNGPVHHFYNFWK
jgi:hydroxymethylpyrimidine/phosphomethylpyrimidine kinase